MNTLEGSWPECLNVHTPQSADLEGVARLIKPIGPSRAINDGRSRKWDKLVPPEAFSEPTNLGIIETMKSSLRLFRLEVHEYTHQLFVPTTPGRYVAVVSGSNPSVPKVRDVRAYILTAPVGIVFFPGTWHAPLMPIDQSMTYLTAMRSSDTPDVRIFDLSIDIHIKLEK